MSRLQQMEPDEFRRQLLGELAAVHRLAFHLTLSADQAEDLVQETFLRALKSSATYRHSEQGPRPWLFKILHNAFKSRRGKERSEASKQEIFDDQETPAPLPLPESLDWEQIDERLKKALQALPANGRSVLLLWAVEGYSYKRIAEVTGWPIGTVMSRLYRARQTLAEEVFDLAVEKRLLPATASMNQTPPPVDDGARAS
jgi:RNA polymerase sigma-70 factor (ECF subfamily)